MSGSDLTNKLVAAGLAWLPASLLGDTIGTTISVLDYGALGDGVHDDTAAIQAALAAGSGGTVYFPGGTYLISHALTLTSDTLVQGAGPGAVMIPAAIWTNPLGLADQYVFITNKNYGVIPAVDENICITAMAFDWSNNNLSLAHSIRFYSANNISILNCTFQGGGDGTALIGCNDTLVQGCHAYEQKNAAYDHWGGATNARVIGNFATTSNQSSGVNFNALGPLGDAQALTSSGCIISDNQLYSTGSTSGAIDLDTLATTCAVSNVVVSGNLISNGNIFSRGNTTNIIVSDNIMVNVGANSAIFFFQDGVNTPSNISVLGNTIINPQTASPALGVIDVRCNNFLVSGNTITGSAFANAIYASNFSGVIGTNNLSTGSAAQINGTAYTSTGTTPIQMGNAVPILLYDTAGTSAVLEVDGSNNLALRSTDASGNLKNVFSTGMRNSSPDFGIYPICSIGLSFANFVRISGEATTVNPLIQVDPNSSDANRSLQVRGKGTGGLLMQALSITGPPGTTDIPSGYFAAAPDGSGNIALYYNNAGTIQKIGPFA